MPIGDFDKVTTLAEDYLSGMGGSPSEYRWRLSNGERLGQAFFNSLSGTDQDRITGTIVDPFHKSDQDSLVRAMEWLLDNG